MINRISVTHGSGFLRYAWLSAACLLTLLMGCGDDNTNGPERTTPEITVRSSGKINAELYHPINFTTSVEHNAAFETRFFVNGDIEKISDKHSHTIMIEGRGHGL